MKLAKKTEDQLHLLFKRGKKNHIKELFDNGEVFINPIDLIRQYDNNPDRSDEFDSFHSRDFIGIATITICEIGKDIDKDGITFSAINTIINTDFEEKGHIYCLTGLFTSHLLSEEKVIEFSTGSLGESLIVIHKPDIFLARLKAALIEKKYKNIFDKKIEYYDENYSGNTGFFKKHKNFEPQSEYRVLIQNTDNIPISINIGPLHDIASFFETEKMSVKTTDTFGNEKIFIV